VNFTGVASWSKYHIAQWCSMFDASKVWHHHINRNNLTVLQTAAVDAQLITRMTQQNCAKLATMLSRSSKGLQNLASHCNVSPHTAYLTLDFTLLL